jgi:hypothetical protein
MDVHDLPIVASVGAAAKTLIRAAMSDGEDASVSGPQTGRDNIRALTTVAVCACVFLTGLFALVRNCLPVVPPQFRPELLLLSMLIAYFGYLKVVEIAEALIEKSNRIPSNENEVEYLAWVRDANDNQSNDGAPPGTDPFSPPDPPKRRRGRPRKNPIN